MAVKVGKRAPHFNLKDHLGRRIDLDQYIGSKNVFLAFFPLAWTPI